MTEKEYALIVAGGKGTRFGHAVPKQFIELNGTPILLHTLDAFYRYSASIDIVLVLPEDDIPQWKEITAKHNFDKPVIVQAGGPTRFHSVQRGLEHIPRDGWVAIHDGVRPLVSPDLISASFVNAREHGCAVAAVHLKESIRSSHDPDPGAFPLMHTTSVDRSRYKIIQTPQTFNASIIKDAYARHGDASSTDDASIAERAGHRIFLFEGSHDNIKITTPEDLVVAAALHVRRKKE